MVIPLPSALTDFSKAAITAIQDLDAIQKAISNPQAIVQDNVVKAATAATTEVPGDLFGDIPDAVSESNDSFLSDITSPKALDLGLQQSALGEVFGSDATVGVGVDGFLEANVRLADVIPSQQLYHVTQGLSNASIYSDPLQAYGHVSTNNQDLKNLCLEATSLITLIQGDLTDLLSIQASINYSQFEAMGPEFFADAALKISAAIAQQTILCNQLQIRGQFDPTSVSDLCTALDDFANLVTFANTKILQFNRLQADIIAAFTRLRQIGRIFKTSFSSIKNFIPNYVTSTSIGKIFQSLQGKICAQAGANLSQILKDVKAFQSLNADDRAKVNATFKMATAVQSIKAFICGLQPSVDVVDPVGPFATLKVGYDTLTASLDLNDPAANFDAVELQIDSLSATLSTGVIKNNAADLASAAASILAVLASMGAQLAAISVSAIAFDDVFTVQTQLDPTRVVGPTNLYDRIGADNARSVSLSNAGDTTALQIAESTTLGQLSTSLKTSIDTLPDGNERDQLIVLYGQVNARHRAVILSMDFTRREDITTFFAASAEEQNRQLVNKIVKTYSGIPKDQFDPVFT